MPSWDEKYRRGYGEGLAPAPFVLEQLGWLPNEVSLLDVAGGRGRHALWAAARGIDVTLVDASQVALDLVHAANPRVHTLRRDLEVDGLPPGTWDVVLIHHFLDRSLLASVRAALKVGGICVFAQPTTTNLERNERPSRRFLLEPGEARGLLPGLQIQVYEESWRDGRHESRVVATRPSAIPC